MNCSYCHPFLNAFVCVSSVSSYLIIQIPYISHVYLTKEAQTTASYATLVKELGRLKWSQVMEKQVDTKYNSLF
jgi:hypothetical protein